MTNIEALRNVLSMAKSCPIGLAVEDVKSREARIESLQIVDSMIRQLSDGSMLLRR